MFKKKKDYDYFDFFISSAETACEAANNLNKSLREFDRANITALVDSMHEIENRADHTKHDAMNRLIHEFITPIEREDISALAHQLDNVVDAVDDVMLRLDMFGITEILPSAFEFSELIIKATNSLLEVMKEFKVSRTSKSINEGIVAVNSYESEGDKLHAECIRALYADENISAKKLLAWNTIFDELEACLDVCENCTDIIETVIMKNS